MMLALRCRMRASMTYSDGYTDGRSAALRGEQCEVVSPKTAYQRGWYDGYYSVSDWEDQ